MTLYENALQVIPVLMIALFLDTRTAMSVTADRQRGTDVQKRAYIVLSVSAFAVSLSVVAGVLDPGKVTQALVIGALMGCTVLMAAQAWRRSERASVRPRQEGGAGQRDHPARGTSGTRTRPRSG